MTGAAALPVLMYHHVSPAPGLVTIAPATFKAQLEWLDRHGYRTVGCHELARFLAGEALPAKSVMLTFDDGYLDNFTYAHPLLAALGQKAVLFLITGWLGHGPVRTAPAMAATHGECAARVKAGHADDVMLRWSEVERMAAAGTFEFHSHTHSHRRWDREIADPAQRAAGLAEDLSLSRASLQSQLGAVSAHLCWPQGYHDADYRRVARAAGFDYLYTVEKGTCTPASAPERLPRVVVKDRADGWFGRRLWLYRHPALTAGYLRLRGD